MVDYLVKWHLFISMLAINIAATNVFFMYDMWIESSKLPGIKQNMKQRMSFVVARTFKTNTICSLAIVLSFHLSNFSKIETIRSIGIFAGNQILVNYLMLIFMFPCILACNDLYIEKRVLNFEIWYAPVLQRLLKRSPTRLKK